MRYTGLLFCLVIVALYLLFSFLNRPSGTIVHEAFSAENDPIQTNIDAKGTEPFFWQRSGMRWQITPRAAYYIAARVLHTATYHSGWQSSFSPVDFALGWGELSDRKVDQWIDWNQNMRWYFFHWTTGSPYTNDYIITHSANVHIVPADENLKRAALAVDRNEIILLEGDLINIDGAKGDQNYWWHTSMTREDTGDGSCELLLLKRVVFDGKEYL